MIGLDEKSLVALYTHHTSTDGASSKMCGYARSLLHRPADSDSENHRMRKCTHSLRKCSAATECLCSLGSACITTAHMHAVRIHREASRLRYHRMRAAAAGHLRTVVQWYSGLVHAIGYRYY